MKCTARTSWPAVVLGLIVLLVDNGCRPDFSSYRKTNLAIIQQMTSGKIVSCEEKYGEVFVLLADKFGDAHHSIVLHPGVSNEDALAAIKAKQEELEKTGTEPPAGADPTGRGTVQP